MTILLETNLSGLAFRGKVRDTYDLGDRLLIVATDRISAYDVVLPTGIPDKGAVLTQMSEFWFQKTAGIVPNHYLQTVRRSDGRIEPDRLPLLGEVPPELAGRAMIVRKAKRIDIECVVRGYLAGSAWAEYQERGTVCGERLPEGLRESEKLPSPIFTPSTKAESGHDQNISFAEMASLIGSGLAASLRDYSLAVFQFAEAFARERGIIIADTKMEFGLLGDELILIDELLTPDSSRFWPADQYAPGRSQPSFDKQPVRDWLTASGWNKEPPAPTLPAEVVTQTTARYREAFRRLTGGELA